MSLPVYNSRLKEYKSIFGAVKCDTRIIFRLLIPNNAGDCHAARLVIYADGNQEPDYMSFWPTNKYEDNGSRWWELYYQPNYVGLYWYHFEYDNYSGTHRVFKGASSESVVDSGDVSWQLTVFDSVFRTPDWLTGGIIYQIFPDRFYYSGQAKKNVPADRKIDHSPSYFPVWQTDENGKIRNNDYFGGDLKGIETKLDYLKGLGVTCIYLNPIFEAHSNHRYNTADYMSIDPLLGDESDFKSLCNEARKRDMHIILDGVFSHTGDDSIYFNKYKRYSGSGAYNSKSSKFYKWYKFDKWPDDYKSWWGIDILPEVNEDNEDYLDYITGDNGVIEKWLEAGADGWRLDVADELPDKFLDKLRARVKSIKPYALVLGEVWEDASNKTSYGQRRRYLLGKQLDSVMNYPFAEAVISFVKSGYADDFCEKILTVTENYPKPVLDVLMNHLSTHDTCRILTSLGGADCADHDRNWQYNNPLSFQQYEEALKLLYIASAIQYTLPGVPSVYYGDEVGMSGYKDPFNRCIFPWESKDKRILSWYRRLGKFRSEHNALKNGDFVAISSVDGCVAYARVSTDDKIAVIANRNNREIDYYLHSEYSGMNVFTGAEKQDEQTFRIPANTCAILYK